jgi:hypothetical protein
MALDIAKVKARLEALKSNSTKSTSLWKPKQGKNVIRIVPYAHKKDDPFIELYFHYGVNNKTYISPISFGRPDPIVEFAEKLKKSGDKDQWRKGRSLEPKMRTYVPILVRGEESEGVKFWGMGKTVYADLLAIMAEPDYGDISDLRNGRDITVTFKTAQECGKDFPETTILVKAVTSQAFDPNDKNILEKVKNQKNVTELWPELSYSELAAVMDTWLNAPETPEGDPETTETPSGAVEAAAAAAPASVTQKVAAVKEPATTAKDIAAEFDDLFNKG